MVPLSNPSFRARALTRVLKNAPVQAPDTVVFEDSVPRYVCRVDRIGNGWFNGGSWVDLMNPAMVRAFIESTYAPYAKQFAGQPHVPGIFTDEPQISARRVGGEGRISFSPVIPAAFKARIGHSSGGR